MPSIPSVTLPNGYKMPLLGFGTWMVGTHSSAAEKELELSLENALEAGYRHIDTAPVYHTECAIGRVLKRWIDSGRVKREDLFIVTKLPPTGNRSGGVEKWIKKSIEALQVDYLDLYIVHTPFAFAEIGDDLHPVDEDGKIKIDSSNNHLAVWEEMEKQVTAGRARAIGLSNFNIKQITRILSHAKQPIANLQIELHVYFQQKELVEFCKSKSISVTAYSPLGNRGLVNQLGKSGEIPSIVENNTVIKLAEKYGKSPGQIALKFIVQNGIVAIPKSTNPNRIKQNINLFDFELNEEDIKMLIDLDQGEAARICDFAFLKGIQDHPEFPFQLERS